MPDPSDRAELRRLCEERIARFNAMDEPSHKSDKEWEGVGDEWMMLSLLVQLDGVSDALESPGLEDPKLLVFLIREALEANHA